MNKITRKQAETIMQNIIRKGYVNEFIFTYDSTINHICNYCRSIGSIYDYLSKEFNVIYCESSLKIIPLIEMGINEELVADERTHEVVYVTTQQTNVRDEYKIFLPKNNGNGIGEHINTINDPEDIENYMFENDIAQAFMFDPLSETYSCYYLEDIYADMILNKLDNFKLNKLAKLINVKPQTLSNFKIDSSSLGLEKMKELYNTMNNIMGKKETRKMEKIIYGITRSEIHGESYHGLTLFNSLKEAESWMQSEGRKSYEEYQIVSRERAIELVSENEVYHAEEMLKTKKSIIDYLTFAKNDCEERRQNLNANVDYLEGKERAYEHIIGMLDFYM